MSLGMTIQEAIATIALEHGPGHDCIVCRAYRGDLDAWSDIAITVQDGLSDGELRDIYLWSP